MLILSRGKILSLSCCPFVLKSCTVPSLWKRQSGLPGRLGLPGRSGRFQMCSHQVKSDPRASSEYQHHYSSSNSLSNFEFYSLANGTTDIQFNMHTRIVIKILQWLLLITLNCKMPEEKYLNPLCILLPGKGNPRLQSTG